MTHTTRAVALLAGVAAITGLTLSAFPEPPAGETAPVSQAGTTGEEGRPPAPSPVILDNTVIAEHRAIATRDVGRSAEREARVASDARRARLAAIADQARADSAAHQQQVAAQIAARKAAEEKARREAAEKAAREKAAREAAARAEREAEAAPAPKAKSKPKSKPKASAPSGPSVSLPITSGYRLTATFGQSGDNWSRNHTGLDFAAPTGTKVRSVAAGRVTSAGWAGAYGRRIVVTHDNGTESWYCHLSEFAVTGGSVAAGEAIGRVGATGNVTGPHLHLEIRIGGGTAVDPYTWLAERGATP